jgi:hypothetical protein
MISGVSGSVQNGHDDPLQVRTGGLTMSAAGRCGATELQPSSELSRWLRPGYVAILSHAVRFPSTALRNGQTRGETDLRRG